MSSSPVVCQFYLNNTFTSGCPDTVSKYIRQPLAAQLFFPLVGVIILVSALYISRLWLEKGSGRLQWNTKFPTAMVTGGGLEAGTMGKLKPVSKGVYVVEAKNHFIGIVLGAVGGIVQMEQSLGGGSFALVELAHQVIVPPKGVLWGRKVLGRKVKATTFKELIYDWKEKRVRDSTVGASRFPPVDTVPMSAKVMIGADARYKTVARETTFQDMTKEEMRWYEAMTRAELAAGERAKEETLKRIECMRNGSTSYKLQGSADDVSFSEIEKAAFMDSMVAELAALPEPLLPEFVGGNIVSANDVARMMVNAPDRGMLKNLENHVREDQKKKDGKETNKPLVYALAIGIVFVAAAFGLVVIYTVLH